MMEMLLMEMAAKDDTAIVNGKKNISLKRNWTHAFKKNEDNEDIKRRSCSLDNQDRDSINEWLIISFE